MRDYREAVEPSIVIGHAPEGHAADLACQLRNASKVVRVEPALFGQNRRRNVVAVVRGPIARVVDAHVEFGDLLFKVREVVGNRFDSMHHRRSSTDS